MKAILRIVVIVLIVPCLAWIGWNSLNPLWYIRPVNDTSYYAAIAQAVLRGDVLYRDVWMDKPPGIVILNVLALSLVDDPFRAVRTLEAVNGAIACVLMFFLARKLSGSLLVGTLCSVAYAVFLARFVEGGNICEEYASTLVLAAILAILYSSEWRVWPIPLSGGLFCLAFLCKQPFFLIALPWFLWFCFARAFDARQRIFAGLYFMGGWTIPALMFVVYLTVTHSWDGWFASVAVAQSYVQRAEPVHNFTPSLVPITLDTLLAFVFIPIGVLLSVAHKPRGIVFSLVGTLVVGYVMVLVMPGVLVHPHYRIILVVPLLALAALGLGVGLRCLSMKPVLPVALLVGMSLLNWNTWRALKDSVVCARREPQSTLLMDYLANHGKPGDSLLTPLVGSFYGLKADMPNPIWKVQVFPYVKGLPAVLDADPPRRVIVLEGEGTVIPEWLKKQGSNYKDVGVFDDFGKWGIVRLFERK